MERRWAEGRRRREKRKEERNVFKPKRGIELFRREIMKPKGVQVLRKRDTKGVLAERKLEQRRLLERERQKGSERDRVGQALKCICL